MKNFLTHCLLAVLLAYTPSLLAQEGPKFTLSGSADTYFRANINASNDPEAFILGSSAAPATSFANLPGFSLGMFNLIGGVEGEKVGVVGDLVFGPRGEDAVFLSTGSANIVNQLYAYWNVSENVKFTLGNFNTFLGYEVISPASNFNYSTSYMFSYGPFSHTGLKVDITAGDVTIMGAILNPTDATDYNLTGDYVFGLQLGYDFGKGSAYANGIFQEGFYQLDLTAGYDITDAIYLGLNTTIADETFSGVAVYLQAALSETFKLGARAESFTDKTGSILGSETESKVFGFTISANYTIDNLTIIPEIRIDSLSDGKFDLGDTDLGDSLSSFILAAVYSF
tara:strand:+ start:6419 stop:7438 length:1020 start_codon:yes stop_codon:yes gene_type:complete